MGIPNGRKNYMGYWYPDDVSYPEKQVIFDFL